MNIAFRVDSSIEIGTGHVMRCLTLAYKLKKQNNNIFFICRDYPGNLKEFINTSGYPVALLPKMSITTITGISDYLTLANKTWEKDANDTVSAIKKNKLDLLVVDHYGIDYRWHNKLRKITKKIMVIDDLANRKLDCDLLLDQTYDRQKQSYLHLVPDQCEMLLGTNYALIRPEFPLLRSTAIQKRKNGGAIKNVLVTMGGMDINNITSQAIKALFAINWKIKPSISVVLNKKAPHLDKVFNLTENSSFKVNIFKNANNMAELMLNADLAIGASGSTAWERCVLGLPTLAICLADNQKNILKTLQNAGAHLIIHNEGHDLSKLIVSQITEILKNPKILLKMSDSALKVCDGNGGHWVKLKILPFIAKDGNEINFRNVLMSDAKAIYDLRQLPETRKFSNNLQPFSLEDHHIWMKKKINDTLSFFWIITHSDEDSGTLRIDQISPGDGEGYLISISLKPKKYSLGIASGALEICKMVFPKSKFYAKIIPENNASISLFTRAGFKYRDDLVLYELNRKNKL